MNTKKHWERIYNTKEAHEVSWTQLVPRTSLRMFGELSLPKSASIIDVGGGDSKFVDFLLNLGYENITVLDISRVALDKAIKRLGERSKTVRWIESDILDFKPTEKYDFWHDRAAFHFLLDQQAIDTYVKTVSSAVSGHLVISTFSRWGPKKCSGLEINQYDADKLQHLLSNDFEKVECITEDHVTPSHTKQNFLFCSFKRQADERTS